MAKIRTESLMGELGRYEYEVHYVAKTKFFEAKKFDPALEGFMHHGHVVGASEEDVNDGMRKVVVAYEKTLNNWKLYIVYKLQCENKAETQFTRSCYRLYRKSLGVDFDVVYYNKVGDNEYYITRDDWNSASATNAKQKPQSVYGEYAVRPGRNDTMRIEHTPELEAFFIAMCSSLGALIEKVQSVLIKPEAIRLLAENQTKLIG